MGEVAASPTMTLYRNQRMITYTKEDVQLAHHKAMAQAKAILTNVEKFPSETVSNAHHFLSGEFKKLHFKVRNFSDEVQNFNYIESLHRSMI